MQLDDLYAWLQERALQEMRAWYGNPGGIYAGSMQAQMGSTTWRFETGSGWTEPELVWYAPGQRRSPYRVVWYTDVYAHKGDEPIDAAKCINALERLAQRLQDLDWHDPRPPRESVV